jgi:hypothetical protein
MLGISRQFMFRAAGLLPLAASLASLASGCSSDSPVHGDPGDDGEPDGGFTGSIRTDGSVPSAHETGTQCGDGKDNDKNGKTDCDDPSCASAAKCDTNKPPVVTTNDGGDDACSTARSDGVPHKLPVDVVWVIDDSASMLDDITRVQQNMATFAQSLVQAGLDDYHIIVLNEPALTLGAPWNAAALGVDASRFFPLSVVAWNDCFTPALSAFSMYSADLRPEAALHFIMVTDDNSLMLWPSFKGQMDSLLGGKAYTVHAIVDPPQHCLGSTRPGTVYWDAAAATGGQQRSICEADWLPTFKALEDSIQSTAIIACQYDIPEPSDGQIYDRSAVNVQHVLGDTITPFKRKASVDDCGAEPGWYYDDPKNPTQVLLCPAACTMVESAGGSINIDFVCESMVYI